MLRIAVQNCRHLLTGDICVRRERRGAGAVDDAVVGCPRHSVLIVAVVLDIRESAATVDCGLAFQTVQNRDEHRAGHGCVRRERGVARACEQTVFIRECNIVIEPVGFQNVRKRKRTIRELDFNSCRNSELVHLVGRDRADGFSVNFNVLHAVALVGFERECHRLANIRELQLRFDCAVLANGYDLAEKLLNVAFRRDVRCTQPAVVVGAIAAGRILGTTVPVRNFMRVIIDIVPYNHIAILQCLFFQTIIRVGAIDCVHPARVLAVGELTQSISTKTRRGVDRLHVVALCTDGSQASIAQRFCKQVIDCCVACQLIFGSRNPCHIFRQIAVARQVHILRSLQRTNESEGDRHITFLDLIHFFDCAFQDR